MKEIPLKYPDAKILIVDDIEDNALILAGMLRRIGYRDVDAVDSGEKALSEIASRAYDSVLLDIMMPGLDGVGVLRQLREDCDLARLPVIMVSALDQTDRVVECLALGADDYMVKPVNRAVLAARLAGSLEKRHLRETERRYAEYHDHVTGLANRRQFIEQLKSASTWAHEASEPYAVLFLKMQGLEELRQATGEARSDAIAADIASRLLLEPPSGGSVARVGGEDFAVLLPPMPFEDAVDFGNRLLETFASPIATDQEPVNLRPRGGVAAMSAATANGEDLLNNAELAMKEAGAGPLDGMHVYDPAMRETVRERIAIATALRTALEREELSLVYQPMVSLESRRIIGFESLMRWHHPDLGFVSPGQFIGVAEETGRIVSMGAWALHEGCRQARQWLDAGAPDDIYVGINVSAIQLAEPDFANRVSHALEQAGLAPRNLKIEITESLLMEDPDMAATRLTAMRDLGLRLSLDDFGTGYSSLSYLHRFPFDELKIDRSFVIALDGDTRNMQIVKAIVGLARGIDLKVVAEGIETERDHDMLRDLGCDVGQGYLYARPLDPAAGLERMLAESGALSNI